MEDDEEVRNYLVNELSKNWKVISYSNGKEALAGILNNEPMLVISDIMMPVMDGFTLCSKLKTNINANHVPVILLTAKDTEEDRMEGIGIGADAYITKPFNILEVKARIKAIMRRTSGSRPVEVEEKVIEKGDMKLDCESRRLFVLGREINLTSKEFDLLELLVRNENKVYSRENLLNMIWGAEYPGDVRTVDVHVRRLREKIEVNPSEPKYVHTKWGVGYYYNQK